MREGYGSHSVSVCVSVSYHASCYIPSYIQVKHHWVSCKLLNICIVWVYGFGGLEQWNGMVDWTGMEWTGMEWND